MHIMDERDPSGIIPLDKDQVWGDGMPPYADQLPGTITLDLPTGADAKQVKSKSIKFLNDHSEISTEVDTGKQDVVAAKSGNKWVLILGVGVAALATAAVSRYLLIRKYKSKEPKETQIE